MDPILLEFIRKNRISVLGVLSPEGGPHSATLHYAHRENPLSFLFVTERDSRKCRSLLDDEEHKASLVIGFSEEEFATLQMEGNIKILSNEKELEKAWADFLQKYPSSAKRKVNPNFVVLQFVPTWWSYRNLKTNPITKISSDEK